MDRDKSATFASVFMAICADFVRRKAAKGEQDDKLCSSVLWLMIEPAGKLLRAGNSRVPLIALIASREVAQKGLDFRPPPKDIMFDHCLSGYVDAIQQLGSHAVDAKDSDFLFRCMEALSWLGCAGVKTNIFLVGRACMRSLAQLGRESRAAKLQCFWIRCPLEPAEHAWERIEWIASWVPNCEPEKRIPWLTALGDAFSVLSGVQCNVSEQKDGPLLIEKTSKPYRITMHGHGGTGTIDFSDPTVIKEFWMG